MCSMTRLEARPDEKGGKPPDGGAASRPRQAWERGRWFLKQRSPCPTERDGRKAAHGAIRHGTCSEPNEADIGSLRSKRGGPHLMTGAETQFLRRRSAGRSSRCGGFSRDLQVGNGAGRGVRRLGGATCDRHRKPQVGCGARIAAAGAPKATVAAVQCPVFSICRISG